MLTDAQLDAARLREEAAAKLEEDIARREALAERKIAIAEAQAAAEVKAAAADLAAQAAEAVLTARIAGASADPLIDASLAEPRGRKVQDGARQGAELGARAAVSARAPLLPPLHGEGGSRPRVALGARPRINSARDGWGTRPTSSGAARCPPYRRGKPLSSSG